MNFDSSTTQAQLETLDTNDILSAFNKATGKATKKFASRSKGIAQTLKALADVKAKAKSKATRKSSGMTFCMAPHAEQKTIRGGTKRAEVVRLLKRANGAKFSEVQEATGWVTKDAYEGIRLINTYSGFGLWADAAGDDDYRIRIVGADEYKRLAAASNG